MALREKSRTEGGEVTTYTDKLTRCVMRSTPEGVQVWAEWEIQVGKGRVKTVSIRCSPTAEAEILALPNLPTALDLARDDTHTTAVNA